ncbi:MAG: ribosome-associated translation inhibitor RaiA [Actinobacteria bacterium]|nr:ribosome-associated translation inhibitor RaiA [Acidimicrobiia bacterium]MCA1735088.1 ribosome-associated translation inhibitor RaiA [Actinomycetota bacterium]MDQ3501585.1 ribosome-associated translation inhibitor RaiA [Actinomycetota bacterium]
MEVRVHTRNTTIDDRVRGLATDKLGHAVRVFENQVGDMDVEFSEEHNPRLAAERYRLEITTAAAGKVIRVVSAAASAETAVDQAADRLNLQLRRLKEKLIEKHRKTPVHDGFPAELPEPTNEIVRIKQFVMKPMTVEEAVLQMEMLGHDFFFFHNDETQRQSVLYRRRDGLLGLIEPA